MKEGREGGRGRGSGGGKEGGNKEKGKENRFLQSTDLRVTII